MKRFILSIAAAAVTLGAASPANAQNLEGKWANPKKSVIVNVARCGDAFCGTVSWATAKNRDKGAMPGTRVLSNLKPQGAGIYKGSAFEPKRNIRGQATVHQVSDDVMIVKGCAVMGLFCKEQRWTRIS